MGKRRPTAIQGPPDPLFNTTVDQRSQMFTSPVYKREVWSYFYLFCGLHGCLTEAHVGSGYRSEEGEITVL